MLDQTVPEATPIATAAAPLPPPYSCLSRHAVLPAADHDETARMNALISLVTHLGAQVAPRMKDVYERRVTPVFAAEHGRPCRSSRMFPGFRSRWTIFCECR